MEKTTSQIHITKLPFYIRFTIVAACLVFTILIMREASSLLIPLFAGLLLAILLLPLVKVLENIPIHRGIAALLAVLCFVIVFGMVNYFLASEIARFVKELPNLNTKIQAEFISLEQWITAKFNIDNAQQTDYLSSSYKEIVNGITGMARKIVFSFGKMVIWTLLVCIFAFFILFYRRLIVRFLIKLVEKDYPDEMPLIITENKIMIMNFIVGLLVKLAILLVLNSSVLILLGIKYALLLALITSLLSIIPYIGFFIALGLALLVTYANSNGTGALTVGIALLGIHLVDGIILLPRIVGSRMKMSPFITFIAVIAGDIVWGIPGMLLFIPLVAMLKIIFENIPSLAAWGILFGEETKTRKA